MEGFIKLCRSLAAWEWYTDANTARVFIHCLIMANWKDGRYQGVEIPRGSFMTGRAKLSQELRISERSVRTALEHLISTNELTIKASPKGSIITVVNYEKYQTGDQQNDQRPTNDRPTTDQRSTSIEEYKEKKKYKKREKIGGAAPPDKSKEQLKEIEDLYTEETRRNAEERKAKSIAAIKEIEQLYQGAEQTREEAAT